VKYSIFLNKNLRSKSFVGGSGAAGASAVETLRQEGYTGRLVLISSEKWLPYDRIKISKQLNAEGEKLQLRTKAFYDVRPALSFGYTPFYSPCCNYFFA